MTRVLEMSLAGRDRELGQIGDLLDNADQRGAVVLLDGAPGIGKSALLSGAMRIARDRGLLVLSTVGAQSETDLPFAGLHQLLRPVLAGVADLPRAQRDAVSAAFGLGDAAAPEPFLIALGVLGLLANAVGDTPLLLSIDDAHWLDRASADVLVFVGRRVEADPIVLLAAISEGYESPLRHAGLPALHLDGLAGDAAAQLLNERFPDLPVSAQRRLLGEAEGNPLALLELAAALGSAESRDIAVLPPRLPLTMRMQQAFAARAVELPAATRAPLLVAAADEESALATVLAASEVVDGAAHGVEDLIPATQARLIELDGEELRFRHALVKSAVYQMASVAQRRAVHLALAKLFADQPDRSVWHRAAAALGPDPTLAADLEQAGRRSLGRGAIATAGAAFERAAELSENGARRARLLLDAAAVASELGRTNAVIRLLRAADSLDLEPRERAQWMLLEDPAREGPGEIPLACMSWLKRPRASPRWGSET